MKITHSCNTNIKAKTVSTIQSLIDEISESNEANTDWARETVTDLAVIMLDLKTCNRNQSLPDIEQKEEVLQNISQPLPSDNI